MIILILQLALAIGISFCLALSLIIGDYRSIEYLLQMQAIQMILSNFALKEQDSDIIELGIDMD